MTHGRSRPRRRTDLLCEELGDELLVFDEQRSAVHALNPTAALIFDCIDGQHDIHTIARRVARIFEIDIETAERDVRQALEGLDAKALLE